MRHSLKFIILPLMVAASLFAAAPASARIGWTMDECRTNWGAALAKSVPRNTLSTEAWLFEKKYTEEKSGQAMSLLIHAEFKDGQVWLVRYSGRFSTNTRIVLLENNKSGSGWEEQETFMARTFWIAKEKRDRLACEYTIGPNKWVEIMTTECAQSLGTQKVDRIKAVVANPAYEPRVPGAPAANSPDVKPGEAQPGTNPGTGSKIPGL